MDTVEVAFRSRYPHVIEHYARTVRRSSWARDARRFVIRHPGRMYLVLATLAFMATASLHSAVVGGNILTQSQNTLVNATTYLAAIGLVIGGYQAWLSSLNNQASLMKEFSAKFFEKDEFYQTWYDLFYSYPNREYRRIEQLVERYGYTSMAAIRSENEGREEGCRRWHPHLIRRTREEARLDRLLGFLNVIGDQFDRGNLSVDEIGDATEYYLLGVANCEAFRAYLFAIAVGFADQHGRRSDPRARYGYPPFRHLCYLLSEIEQRRQHIEPEIHRLLGSDAIANGLRPLSDPEMRA